MLLEVFGVVLGGTLLFYPLSTIKDFAFGLVHLGSLLVRMPLVFCGRLVSNVWWPQADISKVRTGKREK